MSAKAVKKGDVTVAQYLSFQLDVTKKTQREIASDSLVRYVGLKP